MLTKNHPSKIVPQASGLGRKDGANYIGISQRFLDKLISDGSIRAAKIGMRTIILRAELDRFLESQMVKK